MTARSKKKIAVFCSGSGSNFAALAQAVRAKRLKAEIALMVCDKPEAFAVQRAAKAGIPVCVLSPKLFPDRREYEKFIVRILRSQGIDVIVLAGFMRILTSYFISAYKDRIVNIHPSYLPNFKGAHAIEDALRAGVRQTGVTVHIVTLKLDSGPILGQQKVPVKAKDTLQTLSERVHKVEHKLYPKTLNRFLRSV